MPVFIIEHVVNVYYMLCATMLPD